MIIYIGNDIHAITKQNPIPRAIICTQNECKIILLEIPFKQKMLLTIPLKHENIIIPANQKYCNHSLQTNKQKSCHNSCQTTTKKILTIPVKKTKRKKMQPFLSNKKDYWVPLGQQPHLPKYYCSMSRTFYIS